MTPSDRTRRGTTPVRLLAAAAAAVAGAGLFVLGEGWIIALTAALGWLPAVVVLTLGNTAGCLLIAYAYDAEEAAHGVARPIRRVRAWVDERRDYVERRVHALARLSAVLAFVILSVTIGPFLTTIALKVRGVVGRKALALSALSSAIFSVTWVTIYSGGISLVREVFAR